MIKALSYIRRLLMYLCANPSPQVKPFYVKGTPQAAFRHGGMMPAAESVLTRTYPWVRPRSILDPVTVSENQPVLPGCEEGILTDRYQTVRKKKNDLHRLGEKKNKSKARKTAHE
ncbi:hypothetical protein CapIbe_008085 [Capra ibex]